MIYRFVTARTIEETILEKAGAKRKLEKMVIHRGHFKGAQTGERSLSLAELTGILKAGQLRADNGSLYLTNEGLHRVLDRSDDAYTRVDEGNGYRCIEGTRA